MSKIKKHILKLVVLILCLQSCGHKNESRTLGLNSRDTIANDIDDYLSAMEALGFSGAIIVSEKDQVVLRKGYGFTDRENRRPYTPNTVQSTGSNTKQFTGAAILLLESRNQLSVNDSLSVYFKNIPKDKEQITLHQLLTHSSGLVGGVGPDDEPIASKAFFKRLMAEPLEFDPGTSYNYSNAGYSLLGMIIEKISGVNYETFIRENLLNPSGMMKTGYVQPKWTRENMAIGYRNGEKWGEVYQRGWIEDGPNWHLRANGGLHTTVDDMYNWLSTVKGLGVLDKMAVEKWTTGYVTESNGFSKYGYGLVTYDHPKLGKVITHNGSNGIFTSEFFWLPEKEFFFYIHGNSSMIPAYSLEDDILKAAFDKDFNFPPKINSADSVYPITIRIKEGTYYYKDGSVELMADDVRLVGKLHGQSALDVMFKHNDRQKEEFAKLNSTIEKAMKKLELGDENALKDIVAKDEDSKALSRMLLNRISQIGNLESLNVIGTFENTKGSKFHKHGPHTTFVYAKFKNWNQYWNLVWNEDGTYNGNYSGPWPKFILVPIESGGFKAVREVYPWNTINNIEFQDECLKVENKLFCKN